MIAVKAVVVLFRMSPARPLGRMTCQGVAEIGHHAYGRQVNFSMTITTVQAHLTCNCSIMETSTTSRTPKGGSNSPVDAPGKPAAGQPTSNNLAIRALPFLNSDCECMPCYRLQCDCSPPNQCNERCSCPFLRSSYVRSCAESAFDSVVRCTRVTRRQRRRSTSGDT